MKLEFSRHYFEKHSYIKFMKILLMRAELFRGGQADGRTNKPDEANSSFAQFFKSAYNV